VQGGRGSGKTRTGAEALGELIRQWDTPLSEWGIVAPTFGAARDVCVEGRSGILKALGISSTYRGWNRSNGQLHLSTGGTVFIDGADDGAPTIQGKNLRALWADEVGLWRRWQMAWEESIRYAVRIEPAKIIATGTPKVGHPLVKRLINDPTIPKDRLTTLSNIENLDEYRVREVLARYEGSPLGRQELEGEFIEAIEGALWRREDIEYRNPPLHGIQGKLEPYYLRVVVAIDPAGTYGAEADETGIVAAARGADGNGYVLGDESGQYSPTEWAQVAIRLSEEVKADCIVGETNYGGDMVEANLRAAGFRGAFRKVTATRGKAVRAEPVSTRYVKHQIFHVRPFPELEDQQCTFDPASLKSSPDRVDALVWAFTDLFPPVQVITGDFALSG
jgi:phage terminase large subunit-like protein